jgi:methionyl-tRNA formyltransferase
VKTVFFGTPELAVPYLESLYAHTQVVGVITSPDQPTGRGYDIQSPAVKVAADRLRLLVLQPPSVRTPEFLQQLKNFEADVAVVVAYGKLLPPDVLAMPRYGFLNVHFSLLPAYRGAAPIQWALINGEAETGVSLFWLDAGMDTGPLFLQKKTQIQPDEDADALRKRLIPLGVQTMEEGLVALGKGQKSATVQHGVPSHAAILTKEDGRIIWNNPVAAVFNRFRGLTPWPGAYCFVPQADLKARLKVLKCKPWSANVSGQPGSISLIEREKSFVVKCSEGALEILEVQPEGKKPMAVGAWWQGARLNVGDCLE